MEPTNTHIKEHYGLITNDTRTTQFNFLISPPKNRQPPQKHDLVIIDHPTEGENTQIIAEITEINSYEEIAGTTIGERIGKLLATTKILTAINTTQPNQPTKPLLTPPNPGSRVYMPYNHFIETLYKQAPNGKPYQTPLHIGKTTTTAITNQNTNQPINIHIDQPHLTATHTLISATDGNGKTTLSKTITTQLQNQTTTIIDPNNEYTTKNTQTTPATTEPAAIIKKIKPNQTLTITAENQTQTQKTQNYTNILHTIAKATAEKTTPPMLLIIEEADTLPAQALLEVTTPKNGIAAILITNHPAALHPKILNQTQTQLIGKTTNPADLAIMQNMIKPNTQDLTALGRGEFILASTNIIYPTKIHATPP
ncbi:MAG: DUF87 domain-containing protein [Candidatus Bathyarchaeota archaeon]|nr:DUF87 domain-containing protein [Candidatus Bathyarchaeota archaeon]